MSQALNNYTTIRISRELKSKLDKMSSKNETYSEVLDKIVSGSFAYRQVEESIIDELKTKKYVSLDDIKW